MTLTTSKPWLQRAQAEGFAVGAFNANNLEQMQAIVEAAQQEQAPVVIQISHRALAYIGCGNPLIGLRYVAAMGRIAAECVSTPVVLHLDHGSEAEVLKAVGLGFTSVMFDGGDLPLEENIAKTRRLCEVVHGAGITMEAEIGEVGRMISSQEQTHGELTDPEQAAEFAAKTGVDALAIAIGSIHAVRHKELELDLERLATIRAAVMIPLVLHGSSGVTDASLRAGIEGGLCKVNVATQLNKAFTRAVRARLAEKPEEVDPRGYFQLARSEMQAEVQERLRFFGVSGKAEALKSR